MQQVILRDLKFLYLMAMYTLCVTFVDLHYIKLLFFMLFQICIFIEMVKLLENKHFKIISAFLLSPEFLSCFIIPQAH